MKTTAIRKSAILAAMMATALSLPVQASGVSEIDDYDVPEKIVKSSKHESAGTGAGMIVGAVAGGPVGIVLGGITGNYIGRKIDTEKKLELAQKQISSLRAQLAHKDRLLATRDADNADKARAMLVSRKPVPMVTGVDSAEQLRKGLNLSVQFRTDSYFLESHDKQRLGSLAGMLKSIPSLKIYLHGYADQRGSSNHNQALSKRRVNTVYQALVRAGVPADRIVTRAWGESRPLSKRKDTESLNFERRVVITFSK